jgi:hypothetical protein
MAVPDDGELLRRRRTEASCCGMAAVNRHGSRDAWLGTRDLRDTPRRCNSAQLHQRGSCLTRSATKHPGVTPGDTRPAIITSDGSSRRVHGVTVSGLSELDRDVWRVRREDGDDWVARVFPGHRSSASVALDATVLRRLEAAGFPAERLACDEPVTTFDGRSVLVTRATPACRPDRRPRAEGIRPITRP